MFSRPKRTDSEKEILEMQKNFLSEKGKNKDFQPAAKVVRVDKGKKPSLFAQSRSIKENQNEKQEHKQEPPDISNIILGDIVEKANHNPIETIKSSSIVDEGLSFPKVEKIKIKENVKGKSLFALSLERKRHQNNSSQEDDQPSVKSLKDNYGETSMIVEDSDTAKTVHDENLQFLAQMKKEEILSERAKLFETMDPNLIKFLKERRKQKYSKQTSESTGLLESEKNQPIKETATNTMEIESEQNTISDQSLSQTSGASDFLIDTPAVELLNEGAAEKWVHFDVIEKEKLEWMKEVPTKVAKLKTGETFEARFDWKGVLLPYYEENDPEKDNRELYLHGDEPHRPGYTLQELFRLARSNIIQQRISAFSSITGILNIYNQGFYDNILELPITKIFFLLRFGLDENTPSILEVVSKGLSTLFYNDTDEIILDLISETSEGYLQPKLELESTQNYFNDNSPTSSLEKDLKNLNLTSSPFTASIQENDEDNKTSMNDFHLAETDLIECFMRTNIIQRINYILGTVKPKNSTVLSCLKILIRIGRTNKDAGLKIVCNEELMESLFKYFLPGLEQIRAKSEDEFYYFPQYLVLKLFRILMCQHLSLSIKILNMNIVEKLKNYLFTREDIKAKLIKVQIESLRILRAIMILKPDSNLYGEFLPAFRYMLEWHYQHIIYEEGGPFLIRQHAAALFNCISCNYNINSVQIKNQIKNLLSEGIFICSCKWFYDALRYGIQEFSQSTILSSCLNCIAWYMKQFNDNKFKDFIEKYLKQFIQSKSFINFQQNLRLTSILCKQNVNDRRSICPALPNLGAVLMNNGSPQLIISQLYPVYFLNNLLKIIDHSNYYEKHNASILISNLMQPDIIVSLMNFLEDISIKINQRLATNFLSKHEIRLVFKLLCLNEFRNLFSKEILLRITYRILCCMTSEHIQEIEILFDLVIFNEDNLQIEQNLLKNWKRIYLETFVYPHSVVIPATEISLSMPCTKFTLLPNDWPYWLIKSILNDYLQQISTIKVKKDSDFPENEIIKITLTFTSLLQNNGLQITSPTEELMYLMITFMGQESKFLESDMKSLLKDRICKFYEKCKNIKFDFDAKFEGKSKFENLYVLFLDQFQAASYGDDLFSSLVMVPLSQKYDCKWRKMIWSEHASVLRFLNCNEDQLLGTLEAYLYPFETDESLIKCYAQAINSNLLKSDSIPYKIAKHHLNNFRKVTNQ